MIKRAYIIHGWGGHPEEGIKPWLKQKLEEKGYETKSEQMPNTDFPIIREWLSFMQKMIIAPYEEVTLIGHSLGCSAILRYLESLPEGIAVEKTIMVAGVINKINHISTEQSKFIQPWVEENINSEKVKTATKSMYGYFSDDDPFIPMETEKLLKEKYGATTFLKHKMGHFNEKTGIFEFPDILEIIS